MSKFTIEVNEREKLDWSEDESLLALQSAPKPPPQGSFEVKVTEAEESQESLLALQSAPKPPPSG
jgi:hypothetical protein